jgi:hypothetical protein
MEEAMYLHYERNLINAVYSGNDASLMYNLCARFRDSYCKKPVFDTFISAFKVSGLIFEVKFSMCLINYAHAMKTYREIEVQLHSAYN